MHIKWSTHAWNDYLWWQSNDKQGCKKINNLIKSMMRTPFDGEGKPEPLSHQLSGEWSRRIDKEHRIVYSFDEKTDTLFISQCRYHYKK